MEIKTFNDGTRLIVAIDGLDNMPSTENMLKGLFGSIIKANDANVAPLDYEQEQLIVPEDFLDEAYKGMSNSEVLSQKGGLNYLCGCSKNEAYSKPFRDAIKADIKAYLRDVRFKETVPEAYPNKLTDSQVIKFYEMHEAVIDDELKYIVLSKLNVLNWTTFIRSDMENLRKGIEIIITEYKN